VSNEDMVFGRMSAPPAGARPTNRYLAGRTRCRLGSDFRFLGPGALSHDGSVCPHA